MMRIAITGHRGLPAATERLVDKAIRDQLARDAADDHLVGISNLADGADQIFARAVLDAGGQLEAIVPAVQYRDGLPKPLTASTTRSCRLLLRWTGSATSNRPRSRTWRQAGPCWHEPTACTRCGTASPPVDTAAPPM